jgi:hypothetical protein
MEKEHTSVRLLKTTLRRLSVEKAKRNGEGKEWIKSIDQFINKLLDDRQ